MCIIIVADSADPEQLTGVVDYVKFVVMQDQLILHMPRGGDLGGTVSSKILGGGIEPKNFRNI